MDRSGVDYLWIFDDLFICYLDSHSDGTHSVQTAKIGEQEMQC